jgi:putative sigma-54 modulation protein
MLSTAVPGGIRRALRKGDPVEVRVHGNHTTIAPDLRDLAADKVAHAARVFDDVLFADVEFSEEQNPRIADGRYRVEITSTAAGQVVRVEAAAFDERAALDTAVDKYERQLRRLKERLITRGRRSKRLNAAPEGVEEEGDMIDAHRIDRVKRFDVKPMTPEEAALQMDLLEHNFFFFLNGETERYGVLYRRRNGSLGLIEPQ